MGSDAFKETMSNLGLELSIEVPRADRVSDSPSMEQIVTEVAKAYKCSREDIIEVRRGRGLKNYPRKVAMYISQLSGGYNLMEIAAYFEMTHYGGVGSAIHRVKADLKGDEKLNRKINSIVKRLDP